MVIVICVLVVCWVVALFSAGMYFYHYFELRKIKRNAGVGIDYSKSDYFQVRNLESEIRFLKAKLVSSEKFTNNILESLTNSEQNRTLKANRINDLIKSEQLLKDQIAECQQKNKDCTEMYQLALEEIKKLNNVNCYFNNFKTFQRHNLEKSELRKEHNKHILDLKSKILQLEKPLLEKIKNLNDGNKQLFKELNYFKNKVESLEKELTLKQCATFSLFEDEILFDITKKYLDYAGYKHLDIKWTKKEKQILKNLENGND